MEAGDMDSRGQRTEDGGQPPSPPGYGAPRTTEDRCGIVLTLVKMGTPLGLIIDDSILKKKSLSD
jgi:hypothetical protein